MSKTTVLINKSTSSRLLEHGEVLGKSASAMAELVLRKGMDFLDANGYDAFIAISSIKERNAKRELGSS